MRPSASRRLYAGRVRALMMGTEALVLGSGCCAGCAGRPLSLLWRLGATASAHLRMAWRCVLGSL